MDRRRRFRQRSSEGAGPTGPRLQNRWRALRGVLGGFDSHALPPNIMISLAFVDLALAVSKLSPKTVPWRPAQCVQRKGNERAQNENEPAIRDPRAVGGHDHTSRDRRSWQSGRRWPGAAAPTHVPRDTHSFAAETATFEMLFPAAARMTAATSFGRDSMGT